MTELIYHVLIARQLRKGGTNEILYKEISRVLLQGCLPWGSCSNDRWHQAWPPDLSLLLPFSLGGLPSSASSPLIISPLLEWWWCPAHVSSWAQGIKQLGCVAHLKQWRVHRWDWWDTSHPWGHKEKSSVLLIFALITKKQAQESQQICWPSVHSVLICNDTKVIIEYLIQQWT